MAVCTSDLNCAHKVLRQNFFGPVEVARYFSVMLSNAQLNALQRIPFPENVLRKCAKTHILVADVGLSIIAVHRKNTQLFGSSARVWYANEAFATESEDPQWRLITKRPVENSTSKFWQEQITLLDETEEVPSARALVYAITGHYLATGKRLFESISARTNSVDADGWRVFVGGLRDELGIRAHWCDHSRSFIGLAAARKPIS